MSATAILLREVAGSLERQDPRGNKQVVYELKGAATRFDAAVGLIARWRAKAEATGWGIAVTMGEAQLAKDLLEGCAEELQTVLSESPSGEAQEAATRLAETEAQRDAAWKELSLIREAIGACEDESTYDEVRWVMAELKRANARGGER